MNFLHELQNVWTPITKKLINIYFVVIDALYVTTYLTFISIYVVNRPVCGGTAIVWFLASSLLILLCMSMLRGTVSLTTFIPKRRLTDVRCYANILLILYLWGMFNIYMNECYFSYSYVAVCSDIYNCREVYLFLMVNSNVYFLWINSIIIHIVICIFFHSKKKETITVLVEITEIQDLENSECIICLENLSHKRIGKTVCNHLYHYDCIIEWMGVQMTCPICRVQL